MVIAKRLGGKQIETGKGLPAISPRPLTWNLGSGVANVTHGAKLHKGGSEV
jgi:hypothetical protein